ncbi:Uncharacterized protein YsdA [Folsomia candida]|uniref:Uncharacterized protein YsdA n=1 Tax=Folsomia candida TaxID=158441 RepID=A0A226DDT9_FOLCA|nr:Uncharacterized protein YsdA [Folsomia candida]
MDPILILLYIYAFFFIFFGVWSMFAIAADKNAAETRQWRTSEYKLHLLELMGDGLPAKYSQEMDPILILLIIYACFFLIFGIWSFSAIIADKNAAETRQWRTSECKLHFLELMGGWFGSLSAQVCVHHKTRKLSYQIVFWTIVILHAAGMVAVYLNQNDIREFLKN